MRLFVAAYPSEPAADDLAAFVAELAVGRAAASGVNVRLAARSNWHVTLLFLGEVPDERLPDVEASLGAGVARWVSAGGHGGATEPLLLRVGGGGKFGRGKFTVLWAGLRGDVPALRDLSRAMQRSLKRAKLPFDDRRFKPHLTIARPGGAVPAEAIAADRALLSGYEGPPWTIDELVLVRSHLGPKPRYDHLATWPLLISQG